MNYQAMKVFTYVFQLLKNDVLVLVLNRILLAVWIDDHTSLLFESLTHVLKKSLHTLMLGDLDKGLLLLLLVRQLKVHC